MTESSTRARLEEKQAILEQRLASIKRDLARSHSVDSAEQAQERENDEVEDAIGVETDQSLRAVGAALARLDAGRYGICEACGENIDPGRLEVLPEAVLCVKCAE
ncbi:MAG: TraR/DksA family transcriptional regulator [Haliea sp.]|uniref:TraR/DksA family transcriptional regulator n=1 Tax=Haliea sp. TaxID=1932666 RepID=UPI0032EF2106